MRPIFTIHAGEFIVGEYIERNFRNLNVWVPSKDDGIDLLITNDKATKQLSLQVKLSRDYLVTHLGPEFQKPLRACGWWTLDRFKIAKSKANYWVFLVAGADQRTRDFIIIKPAVLLKRLQSIHGRQAKIQMYFWVTEKGTCWESRGLNRGEQLSIAHGAYKDRDRDFSEFLNNWHSLKVISR